MSRLSPIESAKSVAPTALVASATSPAPDDTGATPQPAGIIPAQERQKTPNPDTLIPPKQGEIKAAVIDNRGFWSKALMIASYPVAAFNTYYVVDTWIRRSVYSNFAKRKLMADLQVPESKAIKEALDRARIDKSFNPADTLFEIQEGYRGDIQKLFRKEWNMTGLGDYWKCMHRNQKVETIVYGATVAGITVGALLTVADHLGQVKDIIMNRGKVTPKDIILKKEPAPPEEPGMTR